jgi:hypothetical protein
MGQFQRILRKRDQLLELEIDTLSKTLLVDKKLNYDDLSSRVQGLNMDDKVQRLILKTFTPEDVGLVMQIDDLYTKLLSLEILVKTASNVYAELSKYMTYRAGGMFMVQEDDIDQDIQDFIHGDDF